MSRHIRIERTFPPDEDSRRRARYLLELVSDEARTEEVREVLKEAVREIYFDEEE